MPVDPGATMKFPNDMKHRLRKQSGMTIVEIMIATTISLVLLAGVLQIFVALPQASKGFKIAGCIPIT